MSRIAFVVQRYGLEVNGGAELHCRWIAEHLRPYYQVEVLTTCALDYMTWANHYRPGVEEINGVTVRRFPVKEPRNVPKFNKLSERVLRVPHGYLEELEWMRQQGPEAPGLLDYLHQEGQSYQAVIFFTYLYYSTFHGLPIVPERSLLVPTAHDELPIYLTIFRSTFHLPRFIIYNTEAERRFVEKRFHNGYIPNALVGTGIDVPADIQGERFRQRYGIQGDFVLYVGRIDTSKNCEELFAHFLRFKEQYDRPLSLVLLGKAMIPVPKVSEIVHLGFVEEQVKFDAMQAAQVVLVPSRYESLSMVTMESWLVGTPVLVNGACEVLKENCLQSNGGLWYDNREEFCAALELLLQLRPLRQVLAANGRVYVQNHYSWEVIEDKYRKILSALGAD